MPLPMESINTNCDGIYNSCISLCAMLSLSSTLHCMLLCSQNLCTDVIDILMVIFIFVIRGEINVGSLKITTAIVLVFLCPYY